MQIIRSVLLQDEAQTAGTVKTLDLPVNPLSHIVFTFKCLNVTDEATLAEILARITKVEVLYKGAALLSLSGADLFALNCVLFGKVPILTNRVATDDATRAITMYIPLGRSIYNPAECFKATKKGELQLQITLSSTETACDGVIYQIETVELLGATPDKYMKVTTLSKTPAATGDVDFDLAIGNKLAGLLVFSTTVPTSTSWTTSADKLKFLIDNVEFMIASMNWESLHGNLLSRLGYFGGIGAAAGDDIVVKYGLIDFMPNGGDDFLVETSGKSSVRLRVTAGDTNIIRVLPIELAAQPE
jgi:hypothetical protein